MKKEKYLQIFRYLKEFANLRINPVRDIESQETHYPEKLWFNDIIENDLFENIIRPDFNTENDYWIRVKKPTEPENPKFAKLPDDLEKWVEPTSLLSEEEEPILKDTIEIEGETISIEENPSVKKSFKKYINQQWLDDLIEYNSQMEIYEKNYAVYEQLNDIYKQLFRIFNKSQKFGEEFELVVGVGLLHFKESIDHPKIFRHVLTQRVDINFEYSEKDSQIFVSPNLESEPQIETDSIIDLVDQFDSQNILDAENEIEQLLNEKNIYTLFDNGSIDDALQMFVERISPEGKYNNIVEKPTLDSGKPVISYSPALLLRKRNTRSFTAVYERILENIENEEEDIEITSIDDLIGESNNVGFGQSSDYSDASSNHQPIYFPKEFNDEQIEIVVKSRANNKVLVQGPPGTGKSHTIANLICHLLANGQKVLVTAYTKRALEVLQEQLPQEFKDLVVNLLSGDSSSIQNLQSSVNSINDQLSRINLKNLREEIEKAEENLRYLRENIALTKNRLVEINEKSSRSITFNPTYSGSLTQIAEFLEKDSEKFDWYKDSYCDFEDEQIINDLEKFIELSKYYKQVDISEFKYAIPETAKLLSAELIKEYSDLSNEILQHELDESQCSIECGDFLKLNNLLIEISNFYSSTEKLHIDFKENLISTYLRGQAHQWKQRLENSSQILDRIDIEILKKIDKNIEVTLPKDRSLKQLKNDAQILLNYLKEGNTLSGLTFSIKKSFLPKNLKERLYFIEEVKVNGSDCDTIEEFEHVIKDIELQQDLKELSHIWNKEVPSGLYYIKFTQFRNIVNEVKKLLEIINKSESLRKEIEEISNANITPFDLKRIKKLKIESQFRLLLNELEGYKEKVSHASSYLNQNNFHSIRNRILSAFNEKDYRSYEVLLSELNDLQQRKLKFSEFQQLKARLTKILPNLIESIDSESFSKVDLPDLRKAFLFKHAQQKLKEYLDDENEENLLHKLQSLENKEKRSIEKLASRKAWYHVVENLQNNRSLRQHLEAWVMAVKKIGKTGRGKRAMKFKKIAQREMEYCKDSVPCWIMPLYKVAETIQPEHAMYDYVIIDEASQLGPDAIFLLYISKKIIIVGDDKQTSPEYVGVSHNTMMPHIKRHLKGIPFSDYYGTEFSFFDHARFFCDGVTTLREHFRCMPEIIEFSNKHFYEPDGKPLYPLRQYSEDRLEPLITKYCPNGFTDGRGSRIINEPEAKEIAETIAELVNNSKYAGKTFGVITLQGNQQANVIENFILKEIGEKEFHARNIVCGNSSSFQGDERDVIFLSLVTAHNHNRSALTKPTDERRFNVAVSRAKDQAFLFHSVQLDDLSNTEDLRYKLLDHFQNFNFKQPVFNTPIERNIGTQPEPFDSWFEVDVYNDIINKGYNVIPQYEIAKGKYRIDLVALFSNGTKIAIECDGDKWHGPEQYQDDINRQRDLERCGWEFFRIRGYEYYSNRKKALEPLWKRFEKEEAKIISRSPKKEVIDQKEEREIPSQAKDAPESDQNKNDLFNANADKSVNIIEPAQPESKEVDETVIRYLNLSSKGDYTMTADEPIESDFTIPIKKYQRNGFLLQCYESGHVNKVFISTLIAKKTGREYKNGLNTEGILKHVEVIESEKIIGIYFEENNQRKFKAHLTENISSREQLHLKGYKVIYNKFSNIEYKIFPLEIHDGIKRLVFQSFNANGKPISNSYYDKEWKIIKDFNANHQPSPKIKSEGEKSLISTSNSKDLFSEEVVSLNSIVKIRMLQNKSIHIVKLTTSTSSEKKNNGVQLINHKKPLAVSIKGKRVGDKVKIKNTDNFVEILEIN
jgi:very-short-patch-repair endonuclease